MPDSRRSTPPHGTSGFTLVEMMVVGVVLLILGTIGYPALQKMLNRSKLQGSAREIAVHLGSSRISAMRLGRNVVVKPSFENQTLVSFVDDDEDFAQDADEEEISKLPIPGLGGRRAIFLMGPDGVEATAEAPAGAIEGLTLIDPEDFGGGADDPEYIVAVFEPDGSIRNTGGIRISDGNNPPNVFEVRIDPEATARIEVRKFVFDNNDGFTYPDTDPATGSWFGQGGNMWEWY